MKNYRSAKGRSMDWNAVAGNSVPVEQRELQRSNREDNKPKSRILGGHVPQEPVEESAPKKPRKKSVVVSGATEESAAEEPASEE